MVQKKRMENDHESSEEALLTVTRVAISFGYSRSLRRESRTTKSGVN